MKIREVMTNRVVKIHPEESVSVAARTLQHYKIGALPVCGYDGALCGVVTDRDLVTRCVATGRSAGSTKVKDVMTGRVISVRPDMEASAAAHLMGREQVRRLPVIDDGKLCGVISVGDLAGKEESSYEAAEALEGICSNLSQK